MGSMNWTDNQKRSWTCRLTIDDVKRLKANGTDIADPKSFEAIFSSSLQQIELLAELMRPQWEQAGLDYVQFAELLIESEGRLQEVQAAFVEGLTDFFRRLGEPWMATVVEKAYGAATRSNQAMARRAESNAVDALIQRALDAEDAGFQRELAKLEAKLSGAVSTNAPESSASIQGLGLTAS